MMFEKELEVCLSAGKKASDAIMDIYNKHSFNVEIKEDNSPVTTADLLANEIICADLKKHFPDYAILSEETSDDIHRLQNDYVFIIDPIDGTKDFIGHDDEFAINIALSYKHEVVLGVVYVPALNFVYYATKGQGAFKKDLVSGDLTQIHVSSKIKEMTVLTSRYHQKPDEEALIEKHKDVITNRKTVGSAYKICYIAEGSAEITFRLNPGTKEWDTAAPQIVLEEAGGVFIDFSTNEKMKYNREDVRNLKGYVATNCKENILK